MAPGIDARDHRPRPFRAKTLGRKQERTHVAIAISELAVQRRDMGVQKGESGPHSAILSASAAAIVDWLAEVGTRWGFPADACRVHGLLYLVAKPLFADVLSRELSLTPEATRGALVWLAGEDLVTEGREGWTTQADPWILMMQTLEKRRQRELPSALAVLGPWRHPTDVDDPAVGRQAKRLLDLVEDLAAIDAGTRRLSNHTLRRMVGIGGRAARLLGATGRSRGKS